MCSPMRLEIAHYGFPGIKVFLRAKPAIVLDAVQCTDGDMGRFPTEPTLELIGQLIP
jgi:hypothetical protein